MRNIISTNPNKNLPETIPCPNKHLTVELFIIGLSCSVVCFVVKLLTLKVLNECEKRVEFDSIPLDSRFDTCLDSYLLCFRLIREGNRLRDGF